VRFDVGGKGKRKASAKAKGERKKRRPKKAPGKATPAAVQALKKRLLLRLKKARRYYKAGVEEAEAGQWVKAASSFYLATQYAPKNEEYKRRFTEANMRGRQVQADLILQAGRSAEDYGSLREAVSHYQRAVEIKPPHGAPYFRLGRALRRLDNMDRAALDNLRTAVTNTPNTLEFRMELAACFEDHGMKRNANREYKAAMDLDRNDEAAKAGFKRTR
jgi:Flp pilus assembly protein TadD